MPSRRRCSSMLLLNEPLNGKRLYGSLGQSMTDSIVPRATLLFLTVPPVTVSAVVVDVLVQVELVGDWPCCSSCGRIRTTQLGPNWL